MSTQNVPNKSTKVGGRFQQGVSGNPAGRPAGSRNKTTLAIEALLEGEGENIARKLIELAQKGDLQAVRLCLDRIAPPRKERCIEFPTRPVKGPQDLPITYQDILIEVAEGRMTPGEGETLSNVVTNHLQTLDAVSQPERLEKLEASVAALTEALKTLNRPIQRRYEAKTLVEVEYVDQKQSEADQTGKFLKSAAVKNELPPSPRVAESTDTVSPEQRVPPSKPGPVQRTQGPPHRGVPGWMK